MMPVRLLTLLGTLLLASACEKSGTTTAQERAPAPGPTTAPATLAVTVDGTGYQPSTVNAPAGRPARLVFTRTSDEGCGQQLVFPALNIRRDLPLNQPVTVDITMPASGSVAFTCGMDMLRGSVVVQ